MRDALYAAGRPIVFSICEWGSSKPWEWAGDVGHLWRTTGDISDNWNSMIGIFDNKMILQDMQVLANGMIPICSRLEMEA